MSYKPLIIALSYKALGNVRRLALLAVHLFSAYSKSGIVSDSMKFAIRCMQSVRPDKIQWEEKVRQHE